MSAVTCEFWPDRRLWIASVIRPAGPRMRDVIQAEGRTADEATRRLREKLTGQMEFTWNNARRA